MSARDVFDPLERKRKKKKARLKLRWKRKASKDVSHSAKLNEGNDGNKNMSIATHIRIAQQRTHSI